MTSREATQQIFGDSPGAPEQGFWMNLPDGWSMLDLRSRDVPDQLRTLMQDAQRRDPSFARFAPSLKKQLTEMIRSARGLDVSFAAIFATVAEAGALVSASISVSVHDAPEAADADKMLSELGSEAGRSTSIIELPYSGRVVRSAYLQNLNTNGDRGTAQTALFQYFIPVPGGQRIAVVTCVTPTLPLLEVFGQLFDAIVSTFQFISAAK